MTRRGTCLGTSPAGRRQAGQTLGARDAARRRAPNLDSQRAGRGRPRRGVSRGFAGGPRRGDLTPSSTPFHTEAVSLAPDAGLDRETRATLDTIERFQAAFARCDVDGVMAAMTEDCVFESTTPPDGERHVGQAAVRACWEALFATSTDPVFETGETVALGDRAVVRWRYSWAEPGGGRPHVRGLDLFQVRDGRVAEKLSYVKG